MSKQRYELTEETFNELEKQLGNKPGPITLEKHIVFTMTVEGVNAEKIAAEVKKRATKKPRRTVKAYGSRLLPDTLLLPHRSFRKKTDAMAPDTFIRSLAEALLTYCANNQTGNLTYATAQRIGDGVRDRMGMKANPSSRNQTIYQLVHVYKIFKAERP